MRKSLVAACLTLGSVIVHADQQSQIPFDHESATERPSYITTSREAKSTEELTFAFYRRVTMLEKQRPGLGVAYLQSHLRPDSSDLAQYVQRIKNAVATAETRDAADMVALCARRAEVTTPQQLDATLRRMEKDMRSRQAELVRNAQTDLSSVDKFVSDVVVSKIVHPVTIEVDQLKYMTESGRTPGSILQDMCTTLTSTTTNF